MEEPKVEAVTIVDGELVEVKSEVKNEVVNVEAETETPQKNTHSPKHKMMSSRTSCCKH